MASGEGKEEQEGKKKKGRGRGRRRGPTTEFAECWSEQLRMDVDELACSPHILKTTKKGGGKKKKKKRRKRKKRERQRANFGPPAMVTSSPEAQFPFDCLGCVCEHAISSTSIRRRERKKEIEAFLRYSGNTRTINWFSSQSPTLKKKRKREGREGGNSVIVRLSNCPR